MKRIPILASILGWYERPRTKRVIQVALLLALLTPGIALAAFSYVRLKTEFTNATLARRTATATLAANTLEATLQRIQDLTVSFADRNAFRQQVKEGKWVEAVGIMRDVTNHFTDIDSIILADLEGTGRAVIENDGRVSDFGNTPQAYRDWYVGVSKNWRPYVSEIYQRSEEPRYSLFAVAAPIFDQQDRTTPIGIIVVRVKLTSLAGWYDNLGLDNGQFAYVVDQRGTLAYHPSIDTASQVVDYRTVPVVSRVIAGESGVFIAYNPVEKEERIAAIHPVGSYGWGVVVAQPTSKAFAFRDRQLLGIGALYSVVLAMFVLVGFVIIGLLDLIDQRRKRERLIVDLMPVGLFVARVPDGQPEMVNKRGAQLLGGSVDPDMKASQHAEVYKTTHTDGSAYDPQDLPVARTLRTGMVTSVDDIVLVNTAGKKIIIRATAVPIPDASGKMTSVACVFEDRSAEFELDRQRSEFISIASHQLRTPLTAIKWYGELLTADRKNFTPEQNLYLDAVLQGNERSITLVGDLLDVSRLEAGRTKVVRESVDIGQMAEDITKEQAIIAEHKKIHPVVNVKPVRLVTWTDPRLMRQVIGNLVSNAIKYTNEGGTVTTTVDREGDKIICTVTDTGIGIPLEQQGNIFGKFFRADNAQKTVAEGTGLGLYVVRTMLDMLGGTIGFESSPGKGTTFTFTLPVVQEPLQKLT